MAEPSTTTAPRYFWFGARSAISGRRPGGSVASLTIADGMRGAG